MYADSLARGQLLYRDVVYWFGPFTPYFQSIFLRVFGSSFVSLVISGIVGSLGTLAALYWALRRVSGRREAFLWTALAIPVLIFMPNSGGAILGMGYRSWHPASFSLLAVACASRIDRRSAVPRAVLVGTLCAFAGLSRTEWGLMALAGVGRRVRLLSRWPLAVASQRGACRRRRRPRVLGGGGAVRRARGEASRPGRREHPLDGRFAGDPPVPRGVLPHPGMASRVGRARVLGGGLERGDSAVCLDRAAPSGPKGRAGSGSRSP